MSVCLEKRAGLRSNQSGQAVLEYILVLVVLVAIILGGLYQVNTAFKVWAENYFGSYLSCLLETGELPALGGGGSAGACDEIYEPYSFDKGRPLLASNSGSGGNNSSSSSSSKASQSPSDSASSSAQAGVRDSSGGSSGSSQINPSSRFMAGRRSGPNNEVGSSKKASGTSYTGSTDGSIPMSFFNNGDNGRFRVANQEIGLDFSMDKERERKQLKTAEGIKKSDDVSQDRARKKANPMRAPAAKTQLTDDQGLTFGSYLRYILIAVIIIALVLVVGGQLLQASKEGGGD